VTLRRKGGAILFYSQFFFSKSKKSEIIYWHYNYVLHKKNLILTKKKFQRFYRREYKCTRKIMIETNGMKKQLDILMKMTDPNILSITQTLILSNKNKNNKITKKSSSVTFDHRLFCHVVGKPYEAGNPCFYWLPFGKHSEHFTIQCITLNSIQIRLRCVYLLHIHVLPVF
jgi:hypothetical protein